VYKQTNKDDGPIKSSAGKQKIGLPPQLVQLLEDHRREQDQERSRTGQLWVETGRVFTDRFGHAVKPNSDYHAWKALLKRAGVRGTRLYDARHTAATVLLALEVPDRTVMDVMGWSSTSMAAHYQHVTDPIRHEVASRIGGLLWSWQIATETMAPKPPPRPVRTGRRFPLLTRAEDAGFEPARACTQPAFQASAIGL
jgi:integrase